jgi:hypothetical protein
MRLRTERHGNQFQSPALWPLAARRQRCDR